LDIGGKLKAARQKSGKTQEQVAEALGVSRQTVSNWENGRTYPDIVSVVKMSDLYDISLDTLLKEEKTMTKYTEYLAESTDIVRSRTKLRKLIEISIYLVVWTICMLLYHFVFHDAQNNPASVDRFQVLTVAIILPVVTLVLSFVIGADSGWSKHKLWLPVFFGTMYALMICIGLEPIGIRYKLEWIFTWDTLMFAVIGAAISLVGMGLGIYALKRIRRRKAKES